VQYWLIKTKQTKKSERYYQEQLDENARKSTPVSSVIAVTQAILHVRRLNDLQNCAKTESVFKSSKKTREEEHRKTHHRA
jgi:hypothetical protein